MLEPALYSTLSVPESDMNLPKTEPSKKEYNDGQKPYQQALQASTLWLVDYFCCLLSTQRLTVRYSGLKD